MTLSVPQVSTSRVSTAARWQSLFFTRGKSTELGGLSVLYVVEVVVLGLDQHNVAIEPVLGDQHRSAISTLEFYVVAEAESDKQSEEDKQRQAKAEPVQQRRRPSIRRFALAIVD